MKAIISFLLCIITGSSLSYEIKHLVGAYREQGKPTMITFDESQVLKFYADENDSGPKEMNCETARQTWFIFSLDCLDKQNKVYLFDFRLRGIFMLEVLDIASEEVKTYRRSGYTPYP